MFSSEYCKISKNTYFEERLRMVASPETAYVLVQLQMPCYEQYDSCALLLFFRQFDARRLTGTEIKSKILDYLIQLTVISRISPKCLTYKFQFQFIGNEKEMPHKKRWRRWKGDIENVENIALQDISDSSLERQQLFHLQNTSAGCFCSCSNLQVGCSDLFNPSLPPKKSKKRKIERNYGVIILNRSNNFVFLYLRIY